MASPPPMAESIKTPPSSPHLSNSKHQHHPSSSSSRISLILHQNPNLTISQLKQIHAHLFRHHLHHHPILITHLISSSSSVSFAARLFDSLPSHDDLVLLNSILKLYLNNFLPALALSFYVTQILTPGFIPDKFTFPYLLRAAVQLRDLFLGRQIHASIAKKGADFVMQTSLMKMYFECGDAGLGQRVFEEMGEPDSMAWNVMMSGLSRLGELEMAREAFDGMGMGRDVVSWNILISAYAKGGRMGDARKVFDEMPERNLVSWNALIAGYCHNGEYSEAIGVFSRMVDKGIELDDCTLVSVASACNRVSSLNDDVIDTVIGFAESMSSVSVSTALLYLYAKGARIDKARDVFDKICDKDLVTWNAMISGYAQNRRPNEAIELFRIMQRTSVKPDGVTMVSLLDSCSQFGALGLGEWIHAYIKKNKIELDVILMTALVDMYAKCGDLFQSRVLFTEMANKDLALWNAMINALAIHGRGNEALELFSQMKKDQAKFNDRTFLGLLNACSHSGLVERGLELFKSMTSRYGINPQIEHYGCVVDLLSRAGHVHEAYEFIKSMPTKPDSVVWVSLLGACRSHHNIELAEEAARELAKQDPIHDGNYVLLSNVYASNGKWGDVERIRATMRASTIGKELGWSSVEVGGSVYEFTSEGRLGADSRWVEIRQVIHRL